MKVSDLSGAALEWWALHATGQSEDYAGVGFAEFVSYFEDDPSCFVMAYWDTVGPLVVRNRITVEADEYSDAWHAYCVHPALPDGVQRSSQSGPTYFMAALRCLVAMKYGEEVPDA